MSQEQTVLWRLMYSLLNPKPGETSDECLNRLANEQIPKDILVDVNSGTAEIREEKWQRAQLGTLERKYTRTHDFDDDRHIIVFEFKDRYILIDGNHRVTRWLAKPEDKEREVLIISPKEHKHAS